MQIFFWWFQKLMYFCNSKSSQKTHLEGLEQKKFLQFCNENDFSTL